MSLFLDEAGRQEAMAAARRHRAGLLADSDSQLFTVGQAVLTEAVMRQDNGRFVIKQMTGMVVRTAPRVSPVQYVVMLNDGSQVCRHGYALRGVR